MGIARIHAWSFLIILAFGGAAVIAQENPTPATPVPPPAVVTPPQPAVPTGPVPKLWLAKPEWNFGTIWWGDPCATEIEIRNDGSAPLTINVKSSCGCTAGRLSNNSLSPGQSDKIKLSYDSKKGVVKVSQTITLETNDPTNPSAPLPIRGEIRNLFEGGQQIVFGQVVVDSKQAQSLALTNNFPQPIHLKLQDPPANSAFDVKLEEVSPGKEYKLTATTKPPMKPGFASQEIHLLTGLPDRPQMRVNANAHVQDRVWLQPDRLYAWSHTPTQGPSDIRLHYLKDRPLAVKEVRSSHPDLIKADFMTPAPGQKLENGAFAYHMIKVQLPPYDQVPHSAAQIEIVTDDADPKFQKLVIPINKQKMQLPAGEPAPAVVPANSPGKPAAGVPAGKPVAAPPVTPAPASPPAKP